jgi:hypothetical protein
VGGLWNARFVAKVLGMPAVLLGGLGLFVLLVWVVIHGPIQDWLKLLILVFYAIPGLGAIAWRICRGGEQGPTDVVITETPTSRTIAIGNLPLANAPSELPRALRVFERLNPVPRPIGTVHGSPANPADLEEDKQAALPPHTPVAEEPLPVPEGAQGLIIKGVTDTVSVKLSDGEAPNEAQRQ